MGSQRLSFPSPSPEFLIPIWVFSLFVVGDDNETNFPSELFYVKFFLLMIWLIFPFAPFPSTTRRKRTIPTEKPIVYGFYHRWMVKFSSLVLRILCFSSTSSEAKRRRRNLLAFCTKLLHHGDGLECKMEMMGNISLYLSASLKDKHNKVNGGILFYPAVRQSVGRAKQQIRMCIVLALSNKSLEDQDGGGKGDWTHFYHSSSDAHCLITFHLDISLDFFFPRCLPRRTIALPSSPPLHHHSCLVTAHMFRWRKMTRH